MSLKLDPPWDHARAAATWQRVVASRRAPRRNVARPAIALLAVAAAALIVVAAWPARDVPSAALSADVAVEPGVVIAAAAEARAVALDDGSVVTLSPGAELQVLANDGARFVTLLEDGPARFEVTPGGPRTWTVETALATVEVVGTGFDLDLQPDRLTVDVLHGVVLVRGDLVPGRVARLEAGDHLVVPAPVAPPAPVPAAEPMSITVDAIAVEVLPVDPAPPAAPAPADPIGDALRDADALRAAGQHAEAADRLDVAIAQHPDDPVVGLAAFTLGRIALDALGQPVRAERAFAVTVATGSPASLLPDAHARRIEALLALGRTDDASAALDAFEARFPGDARAKVLRASLP